MVPGVGGLVRQSPVLLGVAALVVAAALAISGNIAVNSLDDPFDRAALISWSATAAFLLAEIMLWLAHRRQQAAGTPDPDLTDVAKRLATRVEEQWTEEELRRLRNHAGKMPVRWVAADADLFQAWPEVERRAVPSRTWAAAAVDLAGSGAALVDVLDRVPTRRLVVLGAGGSGKSILLIRLTLDLLARRGGTEPVPVLLSLASWDPAQGLEAWIENRLIIDYGLGERRRHGSPRSLAHALLRKKMILPVLDGLDEMTGAHRALAIQRIGAALPDEALVIAAREDHYREAVNPPGGRAHLLGAAGIALCPMDLAAVAAYLSDPAGRSEVAGRWDKVVSAFGTRPRPPVARVLTSPLMVALAQAAYNPRLGEPLPPIDPDELHPSAGDPSEVEITYRLLDLAVPTAYRSATDGQPNSRWTAEQAGPWLTFLARHLDDRHGGEPDIAWWRLRDAAPRWLVAVGTGLIAAAASWGWPFVGNGVGLLVAVLVGLLVRRLIGWARPSLMRALLGGVLGGLGGVLLPWAVFGAGAGNSHLGSFVGGGFVLGIVVAPLGRFRAGLAGAFAGETALACYEYAHLFLGIREGLGSTGRHLINALGLGVVVAVAVVVAGRRSPARAMRWSWPRFTMGLATGGISGLVVGAQAGTATGLAAGLVVAAAGSAFGILGWADGTDLKQAASPGAVLARDRATFLKSFLVLGLAVGVGTGFPIALSRGAAEGQTDGLSIGLQVGCANFIAAGLAFAFIQASWGSFILARCWLAVTRRLPWRLMPFLADAHERQLLRQVGAVYQFRHIDLQHHLANKPRS